MAEMVDFEQVNAVALANLEGLLHEWLPNGKRLGNEWQCGDWDGRPGKSLLINIHTGKGSDFSSGEAVGDPIGICANVFRTDRVNAARKLAGMFNLPGGDNDVEEYTKPIRQPGEQNKDAEDNDEEKRTKLDKIVAELVDLRNTPAQTYLKSRGITGAPGSSFKWRPNKGKSGGSLVCIARDDDGVIQAVQSVYLDANGKKANFAVKKRTNGFPSGNPLKIKGDPEGPILLTEGPEDALTLAQATHLEVWCALGLNFMGKIKEPNGRTVIVVRDNDEEGSKPDETINRTMVSFLERGFKNLMCARPPLGIKDSNQLLQEKGIEAVRDMVNAAQPVRDARFEESNTPPPPPDYYESAPEFPDPEDAIFSMLARKPRTDTGNSQRIVARWGNIVKYAPGMGWIIYSKGFWDNKHADLRVVNMAKRTALDIERECDYVEEHMKTGLRNWCRKSQEGGRISYAIKLAQPDLAVDIDRLDRDRMLFNCANGVIDLTTGKLLKHSPSFYCTKQSPVEYDPKAKCPAWRKFLKDIFQEDDELIAFIQRAIGYSLTGDTREQCMFVMHGKGSNGKSTFLDTIQTMTAAYAVKTKADAFMETGKVTDANPFLAMLRSARFVTASETKSDRALDESLIKEATGDSVITARNLHQNPFQFSPQFKLWLATNHKPEIRGTDDGIWRRLMLIPFAVKFYDKTDADAPINGPFKDKMLMAKLKNELPGILAWAVKGCLDWLKQGLNPPDVVLEATREYRSEMDVLGTYLEENTIKSAGSCISCKELYEDYRKWCEENGNSPYSKNKFGRRLYERHITKGNTPRGEKAYVGIKLAQEQTWNSFRGW